MSEVLFWPLAAAWLLPALLVYFGLHVVRREIIFIDLSLAQIASLGTCAAVLMHWEPDGGRAFWLSLGFTLLGAALFAVLRTQSRGIPLEALIGIGYVMAAAASILMLSRAPEGDEEIKQMLVGNILLVSPRELARTAALFGGVAAFHWIFRKRFFHLSFEPERLGGSWKVRLWDFLFYASLGLVVTSFVRIAGVLLVFTYLIVPAVSGMLLFRRFAGQYAASVALALIAGTAGLFWSYWADLPSGAAMVCAFGLALSGVGAFSAIRHRARKPF